MCLQFKSFENTMKEEVAHNKQFLLFQRIFYPHLGEFSAIFIKVEIVVCKLFQYRTI